MKLIYGLRPRYYGASAGPGATSPRATPYDGHWEEEPHWEERGNDGKKILVWYIGDYIKETNRRLPNPCTER